MRNAYFQLVNSQGGCGLRLVPPADGGERLNLNEVLEYLAARNLSCDPVALKEAFLLREVGIFPLAEIPCPKVDESYKLTVSPDHMEATARFYPPSESGQRLPLEEFLKDLQSRKIIFGLQVQVLQSHFQRGIFCTDLVVAKGKPPRNGTDARIEYYFNTQIQAQPTIKEDGTVDFFHLNLVNHCKTGELLARIIPEDPGEFGANIMGIRLRPREVKRKTLKYGTNVMLSEDKRELRSTVNGHVQLAGEKILVSNLFEVDNIDISTGNIDFDGNIQVRGNIQSGFTVKAKGDVVVNGIVEAATVEAGGSIVILRGMNGMGKGRLAAGKDVTSKFLEAATVTAGGNVNTGVILHSKVSGDEIKVSGKKSSVVGSHICATSKIAVGNIGTPMGSVSVVEVGADPQTKARYHALQKDIAKLMKEIREVQPILANFVAKQAKGVRFNDAQKKYVLDLAKTVERKKIQIGSLTLESKEVQGQLESGSNASVLVTGIVYPGTKVIIGDVSMTVQSVCEYCRFIRDGSTVRMASL